MADVDFDVRFCHLSDTHLGPDPRWHMLDVETASRAERVAEAISLDTDFGFILDTGDLADGRGTDEARTAYRTYLELFGQLGLDLYPTIGNHDRLSVLRDEIELPSVTEDFHSREALCYTFKKEAIHFIIIDTRDDREPWGKVSAEQLEWLTSKLSEVQSTEAALICMHHSLFHPTSAFVRNHLSVRNGEEVHAVLAAHSHKILGVLHGHLHYTYTYVRDGITYFSAPSASVAAVFEAGAHRPIEDKRGIVGYTDVQISRRDGSYNLDLAPRAIQVDA